MTVWILRDYRWRECEVNSEIYSPVNQNPWCSCGWKAVRRERCSSNVYPLKFDVIAGRGGIGLHLNANKPAILALWFNSWKYWVLEVIFTGMSHSHDFSPFLVAVLQQVKTIFSYAIPSCVSSGEWGVNPSSNTRFQWNGWGFVWG